jgi:hypothetical protein
VSELLWWATRFAKAAFFHEPTLCTQRHFAESTTPVRRLKIYNEVTCGHFNDQHSFLTANASASSLHHRFMGRLSLRFPASCINDLQANRGRGFWGLARRGETAKDCAILQEISSLQESVAPTVSSSPGIRSAKSAGSALGSHREVSLRLVMRRRRQLIGSGAHCPVWQRFDSVRTKETGGDRNLLLNDLASISIPAPCTHRDVVEAIVRQSQKPIAVTSLAGELTGVLSASSNDSPHVTFSSFVRLFLASAAFFPRVALRFCDSAECTKARPPWSHGPRLQQLRPFHLTTNVSNKSRNLLFGQR